MYGDKRRPAPQPKPLADKGTGHNRPHRHWWWDDYYVWDHDYYDYDDWYYWVYNSAYEKGLDEGRQQGFAHAMNLAKSTPAPVPPPGNITPRSGNVYPHVTTLGI